MEVAFVLGWTMFCAAVTALYVSKKRWGFATWCGSLVLINCIKLLSLLINQ